MKVQTHTDKLPLTLTPPSWRDSARLGKMIGSEHNTFFLAPGVDTPRVDTDPSQGAQEISLKKQCLILVLKNCYFVN